MKYLVTFLTILTIASHAQSGEIAAEKKAGQLCEKGIVFYKQKKNMQAREYLERSLTVQDAAKAHYYLGNVLMNLLKYDSAILHYQKSIDDGYQSLNARYNIACAYSLKGDTFNCMYALLENLQDGDGKINRVKKDSDLVIFRKSEYYNIFLQLVQRYTRKVQPTSYRDIIKFITADEGYFDEYRIPFPNDPSTVRFNRNGTFEFANSAGLSTYGTWSIDRKHKKMVFQLTKKYRTTSKGLSLVKIKALPVEVPFSNIHLNKCELYLDKEEGVFGILIYHELGKFGSFGEVPFCFSVSEDGKIYNDCSE